MGIDLGCAASIADPATYFGPWIERGDVHWSDAQRGWAVIGHDAVADAFRDDTSVSADRISILERVAIDRPDEFRAVVDLLSGWMIFRDPPEHTRLRTPVRSAFTSRRVAGLEPVVDKIVDESIDSMVQHAIDGAADLTNSLARPVPALVIGALLGVDPLDRPQLQHWSDQLATIVFSLSPGSTPPAPVIAAAESFTEFFGAQVRRASATDDDSLIARIAALDSTFEAIELVGMCTMALFAGHETTTALIQNMVATLLERPELEAHLRASPELLPTAVDEFLRVQGPARTMVRKVSAAHERGGQPLEPGQNLYLSIAAANHDPRIFDRPDAFDPEREPNPHLGFGWGLHHCLGAQLARAEAVSVLRKLFDRLPTLRSAGSVPPLAGATMGFHRGRVLLDIG